MRVSPILAVLAVHLIAACSGSEPPSRPEAVAEPIGSAACFARLDRISGLKYRKLPAYRDGQCGFVDAVQLLDIGVPVAGLKAISCPAALALYTWVHDGARPAARDHLGADIVRIQSYGTYACRNRNNQPDARLSEHARANAVDVASFTLGNGRTVTVKDGWRGNSEEQNFLRSAHRAGCRNFNIVIGPDGDRFHQDHFHLDMGEGRYCR